MSAAKIPTPIINEIQSRVSLLDWPQIKASLHNSGWAKIGPVLTADECGALRELYGNDQLFRSRIIMERYRFGLGEYKYFAYPLPPIVEELRWLSLSASGWRCQ